MNILKKTMHRFKIILDQQIYLVFFFFLVEGGGHTHTHSSCMLVSSPDACSGWGQEEEVEVVSQEFNPGLSCHGRNLKV